MNHTVFFLGMLLVQVIFITYQYIVFRRIEFLYYMLYTFCVGVFVYFKAFPQNNPLPMLVIDTEVFTPARSIMLIGYAMYFRFGRHFIGIPVLYPKFDRQLKPMEWVFMTFGFIDITLLLFGVPFHVLEPVSITIYLAAMPFSVYAIIYLLTRRHPLASIYVIGSGLLLVIASIGFIDRIFISRHTRPESYHLVYLELGIFCEFVFLNYGLIYKTRKLQKENIRLEIERQVELYKQRMRISNDLHDEVGATLSGIAMYSQLTKEQMKLQDTQKVEHSLNIMQQSAANMVDKLSDIVWAVNPDQDSLKSLFQKLEEYAQEMGYARNIKVHTSVSNELSELPVLMEERRNIYLICKEAINNAVKYSGCSELSVKACFEKAHVDFIVEDNGSGFDMSSAKLGNGIENMTRRAEDMWAEFFIDTAPGKGTRITVRKKYPNGVVASLNK
jgi:signal transduction histidine kinase